MFDTPDDTCNACGGRGYLCPIDPNPQIGWTESGLPIHAEDFSRDWVQACDNCGIIETDHEATFKASVDTGRPWGWAHAGIESFSRPYLAENITNTAPLFDTGGLTEMDV